MSRLKGSVDTNKYALVTVFLAVLVLGTFVAYKTISVLLTRRRELKLKLRNNAPGPSGVTIGNEGGSGGGLRVTPVNLDGLSGANVQAKYRVGQEEPCE